jgi:hypothetical protein
MGVAAMRTLIIAKFNYRYSCIAIPQTVVFGVYRRL